MRLVVCGGRDFHYKKFVFHALDRLATQEEITAIIEGGASGADSAARAWATARGIPVVTVKADWQAHGRAAGPIRNEEMARVADACAAFPGGDGTRDMVKAAGRARLRIFFLGFCEAP
jgi:predicted Rossmann-fold nucleotide-binding protein